MEGSESCQICTRLLHSSSSPGDDATIQDASLCSNQEETSGKSGKRVKSLDHLWSYFYHRNVRECLLPPSPSVLGGGKEDAYEEVGFGTPKLTFTFSMGSSGRSEGSELVICEECSDAFEKLDKLHRELEALKKSIEDQLSNINMITGRGSHRTSVQSLMVCPPSLEMSMAGSTIGKENISHALRFLSQLCDGMSSSGTRGQCYPINPSQPVPSTGLESFTDPNKIEQSEAPPPSHSSQDHIPGGDGFQNLTSSLEPAASLPTGAPPEPHETGNESVPKLLMEVESQDEEYQSTLVKVDPEGEAGHLIEEDFGAEDLPPESSTSYPSSSDNLFIDSVPAAERDPLADEDDQTQTSFSAASDSSEQWSTSGSTSKRRSNRPTNHRPGYASTSANDKLSSKKPKCKICGKVLSNSVSLKNHIRTHTGERPFKCHFCPKRFAQRTTWNSHMILHSGQRPFKCDNCQHTFSEKRYYTRHLKTSKCISVLANQDT